jgi:hypothetical protein
MEQPMPGPLKNTRHERYCQAILKGKTQPVAYKLAGYNPHKRNSERLAARPDIIARIAELKEKTAEKAVITAADIARQLDEDRAFARQCKQAAAAVSASIGKAKVLGLVVNRIGGPDGGPLSLEFDLSKLSDKDLHALERIHAKIATPGIDPGGTGQAQG